MAPPPKLPPFDPARRRFLTGVAGAAGTLVLPGCGTSDPATLGALAALPKPEDSGIDHIVQVMMENRSFDHYLGWVPGAEGRQSATFRNSVGSEVPTFHLAADPAYGYQGCGWADPNHNYAAGRTHYNNGAMDGWLQTSGTADNPEDRFPAGYYKEEDLKFFSGVAQNFTVCDRYHHGFLGSTFPNRIYMHSGATDRMQNDFYPPGPAPMPATIPTIWDRLAEAGISRKSYYSDVPITAFWGEKYADISATFQQFLTDAAAGQLPAVSYFDPNFGGGGAGESPNGVSRDDHPQADIRDGQVYLTQIYNALRASPNWERTLMIVTYDEWGGFFDHVAPGFSPVSAAETALGNDGRLGFRVPCVIIGPRARRGHVSHLPFDPNSVINLIRWRFNLPAVGDSPRNQNSLSMAYALDFESPPNLDAPAFGDLGPDGLGNSAGVSYGASCQPAAASSATAPTAANLDRAAHNAEWRQLRVMARAYGYPV